jgi:hypothetical protein
MGACLDPTPAMGPYLIEMRGQSFYLTRTAAAPHTRAGRHEALLPAADLPHIAAALGQVMTHPWWNNPDRAERTGPADLSWTLPPDGTGPLADPDWTLTPDGDALRIRGPWSTGHERNLWSAEIEYADATALLDRVTSLGPAHPSAGSSAGSSGASMSGYHSR